MKLITANEAREVTNKIKSENNDQANQWYSANKDKLLGLIMAEIENASRNGDDFCNFPSRVREILPIYPIKYLVYKLLVDELKTLGYTIESPIIFWREESTL